MTKDNHEAETLNNIWVSTVEGVGKCEPEGYWKNNQYPAVFKQSRDGCIKFGRANSLDVDLIERALREMLAAYPFHGNLVQKQARQICIEALREIERAKENK